MNVPQPYKKSCADCGQLFNKNGEPIGVCLRPGQCPENAPSNQHSEVLLENPFKWFSESVVIAYEQKFWMAVTCLGQAVCAFFTYTFRIPLHHPVIAATQLVILISSVMAQLAVRSLAYRFVRKVYCKFTDPLFRPKYASDAMGAVKFCDACATDFDLGNNLVGVDRTEGTGCTLLAHVGKICPVGRNDMLALVQTILQDSEGYLFIAAVLQASCAVVEPERTEVLGALLLASAGCTFMSVVLGIIRLRVPSCIDPLSFLFGDREDEPDGYPLVSEDGNNVQGAVTGGGTTNIQGPTTGGGTNIQGPTTGGGTNIQGPTTGGGTNVQGLTTGGGGGGGTNIQGPTTGGVTNFQGPTTGGVRPASDDTGFEMGTKNPLRK